MNKAYLTLAAQAVAEKLPDNHGFILLTFPFGDDPETRLSYASNANREDALNAIKEWLIKAGAAEDWMKHSK